jgi:hypothetical protein
MPESLQQLFSLFVHTIFCDGLHDCHYPNRVFVLDLPDRLADINHMCQTENAIRTGAYSLNFPFACRA